MVKKNQEKSSSDVGSRIVVPQFTICNFKKASEKFQKELLNR
jgi:hypothetical protein